MQNVQDTPEHTVSFPDKPVLSTGDLAEFCHVTKHTIISAIERGELEASRTPGGHNRIRRGDAVAFMQRHNFMPTAKASKILVVDDEAFVYDIVEEMFGDNGYKIFYAANGYEAGKLAERERPDVILLDILLPDVDGRDVCRHIREEKFGKDCSILAVTALKEPQDVQAIYEAGIDHYIAKPFRIEELRGKVEELLEAKN